MGLAGPRKKVKLSHDPNNTKWTRDTEGFGHKIMSAQGWQPGDLLGVKDAPHAEFHTEANASHIRVFIKDDNLGLGAKKGSGLAEGECTGLDVFQTLLGRLNGRDEDELAREQKSREELKRAIYSEAKWGTLRFVPGGFLVGDKIQKLIEDEAERVRQNNVSGHSTSSDSDSSSSDDEAVDEPEPIRASKSKSSKKRRAGDAETVEIQISKIPESKKSGENSKKSAQDIDIPNEATPEAEILEKRKKRNKRDKGKMSDQEEGSVVRNIEKKSKKKATRKEKPIDEGDNAVDGDTSRQERKNKRKEKAKQEGNVSIELPIIEISKSSSTGASTPSSQPGTPQALLGGRHAVRSRNIAQKRLAVMDAASLAQIFMIKS